MTTIARSGKIFNKTCQIDKNTVPLDCNMHGNTLNLLQLNF